MKSRLRCRGYARRFGIRRAGMIPLRGVLTLAVTACLAGSVILPLPALASTRSQIEIAKGQVALEEGDFAAARAHFQEAVAADPDDPGAHYYLGVSESRLGNYPEAVRVFQRVIAIDPEYRGVHSQFGLVLFADDLYRKALEQFEEAASQDPDSPHAQYYIGLSRYRLLEYNEAVQALQNARRLSPEFEANASYYLGVCYFRIGNLDGASKEFKRARDAAPDSSAGRASDRFLTAIERGYAVGRPWELAVWLGFEWDDNVIILPESLETPDTIAHKTDTRLITGANGRVRHAIHRNWIVGASSDLFFSFHKELDAFDIQDYLIGVFSEHPFDFLTFRLQYLFDWANVDRDSFVRSNRLTPSVMIPEGSIGTVRIFYEWQNVDFFLPSATDALDRDGTRHSVGFDQFFYTFRKKGYVRVGFTFRDIHAQGNDFSREAYEIRAGARIPLIFDINGNIIVNYFIRNFDNRNSLDAPRLDRREDGVTYLVTELSRRFGPKRRFEGAFRYRWTNQNTNVDVYKYKRNIYGLILRYNF